MERTGGAIGRGNAQFGNRRWLGRWPMFMIGTLIWRFGTHIQANAASSILVRKPLTPDAQLVAECRRPFPMET
jgi:hypothetical protein